MSTNTKPNATTTKPCGELMTKDSLFGTDNTVSESTDETPDVDYVAYVTDKFKGNDGKLDIAALARGKYEADQAVKFRDQKADEMRAELAEKNTIDELMSKITALTATATNPVTNRDENSQTVVSNTVAPADIAKIVREAYTNERTQEAQTANLRVAQKEAQKALGDDYEAKIKRKALEIGLSVEQVVQIAKQSPTAFANILGINQTTTNPYDITPPKGSIRGIAPGGVVKDANYWKKFKADNGTDAYYSPEVSREREQWFAKLGAGYYNR